MFKIPWTVDQVDEFKKGLTDKQKEQWKDVANSVLEDCLEQGGSQDTCEEKAIKQANGVVGQMKTNEQTTNQTNGRQGIKGQTFQICAHAQTGEVRKETFNGSEYLVAPVVAVGEGVLKGKYLPAEEIQYTANLWEDSPLPVVHPEDAGGNKISARSKEVIESQSIGRFYNVRYDDGKLKGELWINIEKAKAKGGEYEKVIDMLEMNQQLEVSTGFYSSPEPQSGTYQGEHYNAVHRGVIPDHLSLLPESTGECSWADGCGAPRINSEGKYMGDQSEMTEKEIFENARSTARTPAYSSVSMDNWSAPNLEDFGYDSVDAMSSSEKTEVAETSLLGEAGADTWAELVVLPVVDEKGVLYKNAVVNAKARVSQVSGVSSDTVQSVKDKCTQLLEEEFDVETEEEVETNEVDKNKALKLLSHINNFFTRGEDEMSRDELLENLTEELNFEEKKFEGWTKDNLEEFSKKFGILESEEDEVEANSEDEETDNKSETPDKPETNSEPETEEETTDSENENSEGTKMKDKLTTEDKEELYKYFSEKKEREDRRQELIDNIQKYDESIDKDSLEDAPVKTLETMLSSLKPADYSGQGGPRNETSEDELEWLDNREEKIRGEE